MKYLTVKKLAAEKSISVRSIRSFIKTGLPHYRPGEHNICFRMVDIDFEAVKQAYEGLDLEKIADVISFIQIYVEGDNFALDDEYYKGGVTG